MSYRGSSRPLDQITQGIDSDVKLYEIVDQMFRLPEHQIRRVLGYTSTTAYRRVHERLASSIDRAIEYLKNKKDVTSAIADLTKSLVLVRYQRARNQLSENLASILEDIINKLVDEIRKASDKSEDLMKKLERARSLIDAIAVLAYEYGK